jgi:hypothetical protein
MLAAARRHGVIDRKEVEMDKQTRPLSNAAAIYAWSSIPVGGVLAGLVVTAFVVNAGAIPKDIHIGSMLLCTGLAFVTPALLASFFLLWASRRQPPA